MYRMSQRILIIILVLISILFFNKNSFPVERVFSLSQAPDKTSLSDPCSVIFEKDKFYVVDSGNRRLISYDLKGKPLVAFNPEGKLKYPIDFSFRNRQELWVIDKAIRGLYRIDLAKKIIKSYILKYKNRKLYPVSLQFYQNKMYLLDKETGGIVIIRFENENLVIEKILIPQEEDFKGFSDFRVKKNSIWALSRLNKKVYHWDNEGNFKIFSLKKQVVLPVSLEVIDNKLFILDRYLAKVFIFELPSLRKIDEFGEKGWGIGQFYRPIKIRNLYYNYIGIVDEGNGKVEIFQY